MLKEITIVKEDKIDLDIITQDAEEFILSDDYCGGEDLEEIVDDIISEYVEYNPYSDEINEKDEILEYVEKHLSKKALEILDN